MSFPKLVLTLPLFTLAVASGVFGAEGGRFSPEQLQQYLKQYPEADTNGDGTLSPEEARAYLQKMRGAKAEKKAAAPAKPFPPTHANVSYGPDARQVLDFWAAKTYERSPVVVFIHGGGFVNGDKSQAGGAAVIQPYLDAGVEVGLDHRGAAGLRLVAVDEAAAVDEDDDRGALVGLRRPEIENLACVGAVADVRVGGRKGLRRRRGLFLRFGAAHFLQVGAGLLRAEGAVAVRVGFGVLLQVLLQLLRREAPAFGAENAGGHREGEEGQC